MAGRAGLAGTRVGGWGGRQGLVGAGRAGRAGRGEGLDGREGQEGQEGREGRECRGRHRRHGGRPGRPGGQEGGEGRAARPALPTVQAFTAARAASPPLQFPVRRELPFIVLALVALVVPLPPSLVERVYSRGVFSFLQPMITALSNLTSVAWFDLLLGGALGLFAFITIRDLRRRRGWLACGRLLRRVLVTTAAVYLAFLVMWGLNYRRESMRARVPFDTSSISVGNATVLARSTVEQLNALHDAAHAAGWGDADRIDSELAASFTRTLERLQLPARTRPARPKVSVLDLYFRRAAVAGMTDPFFLETLIAGDTLPFERAHVVAHEWAHLAGITDEGEANFVGWLTCVNGSVSNRYSGWLFLYSEILDAVPSDVATELRRTLNDGPREDLRAIRARYQREVSPRLAGAGWQVYDSYLKANRVEAGTASYAEVVQLILGTGLR